MQVKTQGTGLRGVRPLKKSEGAFRPPRLIELFSRPMPFPPGLKADAKCQLNDPVGTGAGTERGRRRIAQTSKIRCGQVFVRAAASENAQSQRLPVSPKVKTTVRVKAINLAVETGAKLWQAQSVDGVVGVVGDEVRVVKDVEDVHLKFHSHRLPLGNPESFQKGDVKVR